MSVESAFTYCSYVVARIAPEPQRGTIWEMPDETLPELTGNRQPEFGPHSC